MEELNKNYISLSEASKHCVHSQEYLSLRARQGKLKAVKIGRNWLTKKEWLDEYIAIANGEKVATTPEPREETEEQFISLHEAAKLCQYSQEYLSLRARQGKLKAVKLGRHWLTKQDWLKDYVTLMNGEEEPVSDIQDVGIREVVKEEIKKLPEPSFAFPFPLLFQPVRRALVIGVCALVLISIAFGLKGYLPLGDFLMNVQKQVSLVASDVIDDIAQLTTGFNENISVIQTDVFRQIKNYRALTTKTFTKLQHKTIDFVLSLKYGAFGIRRGLAKNILVLKISTIGYAIGVKSGGELLLAGVTDVPQNLKYYLSQDIKLLEEVLSRGGENLKLFAKEMVRGASLQTKEAGKKLSNAGKMLAYKFRGSLNLVTQEMKKIGKTLEHQVKLFGQDIIGLSKESGGAAKTFARKLAWGAKKVEGAFSHRLATVGAQLKEMLWGIKDQGRGLMVKIKNIPQKIVGLFKKDWEKEPKLGLPSENALLSQARKGLVVVPSTAENEEMLKKIKASFSDEVKVFPKDASSGIVVPIFREREGEEYLYLMVPVASEKIESRK